VNGQEPGLPIEQFIQALTAQLDRVQTAMALKAKAGLPLTFAVKDLRLDLRTHVDMVNSVVMIRPAAPGEVDASTLHLDITTITRPMIEENTISLQAQAEPSLKQVLGPALSDDEQRRLEWIGVQSVSQLRQLHEETGEAAIERAADIPVSRLRMALERSSRPFVTNVEQVPPDGANPGAGNLLRLRGLNLVGEGNPLVHIDDHPAPVVSASPGELVVAPPRLPDAGTVSVQTAPGLTARRQFQLATQ
jgi:hypothetical protein